MRFPAGQRWITVFLFICAALLLVLLSRGVLVRTAERFGNPVSTPSPYRVSDAAEALHQRYLVADLHADTLLSARDPRVPAKYGQLDLPRLRAAHVGLQVFSIVTNMPACGGFIGCGRYPNLVS